MFDRLLRALPLTPLGLAFVGGTAAAGTGEPPAPIERLCTLLDGLDLRGLESPSGRWFRALNAGAVQARDFDVAELFEMPPEVLRLAAAEEGLEECALLDLVEGLRLTPEGSLEHEDWLAAGRDALCAAAAGPEIFEWLSDGELGGLARRAREEVEEPALRELLIAAADPLPPPYRLQWIQMIFGAEDACPHRPRFPGHQSYRTPTARADLQRVCTAAEGAEVAPLSVQWQGLDPEQQAAVRDWLRPRLQDHLGLLLLDGSLRRTRRSPPVTLDLVYLRAAVERAELSSCPLIGWTALELAPTPDVEPRPPIAPVALFPAKLAGGEGFLDAEGEVALPGPIDDARPFHEDLAAVRVGEVWGFIGTDGRVRIEPAFDEVRDFSEGLAPAKSEAGWGFIDPRGRWVVPPAHEDVTAFSGGRAAVATLEGQSHPRSRPAKVWHIIDRRGHTVGETPLGVVAGTFSEELLGAAARGAADFGARGGPRGRWGFLGRDGEWAFQRNFYSAGSFSEGLAPACLEPGLCGYIDRAGRWVIAPRFGWAGPFSEGLAAVDDGHGSRGYIDRSGEWVIDPGFHEARPFSEGRALVRVNAGWGYIDREGREVIPAIFQGAQSFQAGRAWVLLDDGQEALLDPSGEGVWQGPRHPSRFPSRGGR